jgi:hypothetical protein
MTGEVYGRSIGRKKPAMQHGGSYTQRYRELNLKADADLSGRSPHEAAWRIEAMFGTTAPTTVNCKGRCAKDPTACGGHPRRLHIVTRGGLRHNLPIQNEGMNESVVRVACNQY